jgi:hypothetical protein
MPTFTVDGVSINLNSAKDAPAVQTQLEALVASGNIKFTGPDAHITLGTTDGTVIRFAPQPTVETE